MRLHFGGSLLPSSEPRILKPIKYKAGFLQVRPIMDKDTYHLVMSTPAGEEILASHPNGYSCHALAERLVAGDKKRIQDQADCIVMCGGTSSLSCPKTVAEHYKRLELALSAARMPSVESD